MQTYQQVSDLIDEKLPTASFPLITAEEHREVEKAILNFARDQWLPGDIKEIDCTNDYIASNFTSTGFGIGERAGWAICNGLNGTKNRIGRVSVGYGGPGAYGANRDPLLPSVTPTFTSIGGDMNNPVVDGLKDAVVVSHTHPIRTGNAGVGVYGPVVYYGKQSRQEGSLGGGGGQVWTDTISADSTGVSGTNKNMQPYIVTLFIQKL